MLYTNFTHLFFTWTMTISQSQDENVAIICPLLSVNAPLIPPPWFNKSGRVIREREQPYRDQKNKSEIKCCSLVVWQRLASKAEINLTTPLHKHAGRIFFECNLFSPFGSQNLFKAPVHIKIPLKSPASQTLHYRRSTTFLLCRQVLLAFIVSLVPQSFQTNTMFHGSQV